MIKTALQLLTSLSLVLTLALTLDGILKVTDDSEGPIASAARQLTGRVSFGFALDAATVLAVSAVGLAIYETRDR